MTSEFKQKNIVQKFFWLIIRPAFYPKLFSAIKIRLNKLRGYFWCRTRSITTEKALQQIVGEKPNESFYKKYETVIRDANQTVKRLPVTMGGGGNLELLYHIAKGFGSRSILETGVAYGWSSLAFLLAIGENKNDGKVVSTDMLHHEERDQYIGCVVPEYLCSNWKLITEPDKTGIDRAIKQLGGEVDLCHYDSDKTYEGRLFAYPKLWKVLRPGGVLLSDDINDNLAFRDFSRQVGEVPLVVETHEPNSKDKYVGILVKTSL